MDQPEQQLRILIADDDKDVLQAAKLLLNSIRNRLTR